MRKIKLLAFLAIFLVLVIAPVFSATSYTHEFGVVDFDTHQLIPSTVTENTGFGVITKSNSGQYYTFTVKSNFVVTDAVSSLGYDSKTSFAFYDSKLKQSCLGKKSCSMFTSPHRTTCEFDHISTTGFERFNCNVENTNNGVIGSFDYFAKMGSNIEVVRDLSRLRKTVVSPPKNSPPVAILLPNQTSGVAPLIVKFTLDGNDADGFIKKWTLLFGDGQSISGAGDPNGIFRTHTYVNAGIFTAKLTVTDNVGASASKEVMVNVGPPLPPDLPVEVTLNAQPVEGVVPLTVNFVCKASGNKPFNYKIAFGDGNLALDIQSNKDEFRAEHIYRIAGNFEAGCTVTDSDGDSGRDTLNINVKEQVNNPPVAILSANTTSGFAPLVVKFTLDGVDSDGFIASWALLFGDAQFESDKGDPNGLMLTHTYANPGMFNAKLTVTDNKGASRSKIVVINVEQPLPQCSDGLDNDGDGSVDFPLDFGCESLQDNNEINDGNTQCSDGLDNDNDGKIDQDDPDCENRNDNDESTPPQDRFPKAEINVNPDNGTAPLQSLVSCLVKSGDAPFTYIFSFGDGSSNVNVGPTNLLLVNVNHVYLNAGQFTTSCKVTDVDGDFDLDSQNVTVNTPPKNNPPVAILIANTTSGPAPLAVKFTLDGVDSDGFIASWVLLFGDGQSQFANGDPNGLMINHVYQNQGTFNAKLTVRDNRGASRSKIVVINVGQPLPQCSDGLDNDGDGSVDFPADFGCESLQDNNEINDGNTQCSDGLDNDNDGKIDQDDPDCENRNDNDESTPVPDRFPNVSFVSNVSNGIAPLVVGFNCSTSDGDSPFRYNVSFGDGSFVEQVRNQNDFVVSHIYQNSGNFLATCKVTDVDGDFDMEIKAIQVSLRPVFECSDGIDNDLDGLIDFPADPGCTSPSDNDERNRIDGENRAPVADFLFSPKNPFVNSFVLFDGSLSSDPDGDVLSYLWDFDNDGKIDSKVVRPNFKFRRSGRFKVTLTVSDGVLKDSEVKEVVVRNKDGSVDERRRGLTLRKKRQMLTQMYEPEFLEQFSRRTRSIEKAYRIVY